MKVWALILAAFCFARTAAAGPALTAEEIIARLIQRTEDPALDQARGAFAYQRVSRVDYLDENGTLEKQAVRLYQIVPENGKPVSKLLSINGQPPKDREEKRKSPSRETGDKTRKLKLDRDLLSRFDYSLEGEDRFMGRPVWVLGFKPKADAPENAWVDKLINSMTGTLRVDQEEFQMVQADLHLSRRVSFFGGIAGAIDQLNLRVIQKRVAPSVWLSEALTLDFVGRKLLSPVRLKCFENCSDFRRVPSGRLGMSDRDSGSSLRD